MTNRFTKMWKVSVTVTLLASIVLGNKSYFKSNDEARQTSEALSTILGKSSNKVKFPLVGMGVGNLAYDRIDSVLTDGIFEHGYRMLDTAHASDNEEIVRDALMKLDGGEVHVVTKVWYTHLGYERTRLSVKESVEALTSTNPNVKVRIHVLLHWPRCRDDISWMDCEGEEERLAQYVKDAGPPPHLNPNMAWRHSWRALEEMMVYPTEEYPIASIGVSNFEMDDAKSLLENSMFSPMLVQLNLWSLIFDPHLIKFYHEADVKFQVYNVMNGVFGNTEGAPNAYEALLVLAATFASVIEEEVTAQQLVLGWLVQSGISVIPRTSSEAHLAENSAPAIARLPRLQRPEIELVKSAVGALLRGVDLEPPQASFTAPDTTSVHLYWVNPSSGEEVPAVLNLPPEETFHVTTRSGHAFVAYDETRKKKKSYVVKASFGDHDHFHIDL